LGLAVLQYTQDYDERTCGAYGNSWSGSGSANPPGPVTGWSWAGGWWSYADMIHPYVKNSQCFTCPSGTTTVSYNANQNALPGSHTAPGQKLGAIARPAECIMLFDSPSVRSCGQPHGWRLDADGPWAYCYGIPAVDERKFSTSTYAQNFERHNGGCNYVFMDGHAKWLSNMNTYATSTSDPNFIQYWSAQ